MQVLTEARREAIPIDSLQRKLMYGMIQLYVDKDENPFSGWVKVTSQNGKTQSLGFLKKGAKRGILARMVSKRKNKIQTRMASRPI